MESGASAYADVDCAQLARYDYNKQYAQGALVRWADGAKAEAEYRCKNAYCGNVPSNSEWEQVDTCRKP